VSLAWFAWIAHIMSWLLIPALVGFLVADRVTAIRQERVREVETGYAALIRFARPDLSAQEQEALLNDVMSVFQHK
jgi:hypothetical protein